MRHSLLLALACVSGAAYADPHIEKQTLTLRSDVVELAVAGGLEPIGWSGVPENVSRVAVGRQIAGGRAELTAALGVGVGRSERSGDLDLWADHPVGGGVFAGVDARYQVDLALDPDDSPAEREWDGAVTAFTARGFGRCTLIGGAGVTAVKQRFGVAHTGALATVGVAASFW